MTTIPTDRDARDELLTRYVLSDLTAEEARDLEGALATDPALAAEVAELRAAFESLAYATAAAPPPGLRDRVLHAAAPRSTPPGPEPRRLLTWQRAVGSLAAALALAIGLDNVRLRRDLALQHEVMTTLQQPNVLVSFALAGVEDGAFGRVVLDLDAKKAAVVIHHLPPPPSDQVYRLWARVEERHVPCGNLTVRGDGTVMAQLPIPVDAYTSPVRELVLTREASGTASTPTGPTVMRSS